MLPIGEYVVSPVSRKLHIPSNCINGRVLMPWRSSCFRARQRKYEYGCSKIFQSSTRKLSHLSVSGAPHMKVCPCLKETSLACICLGSLVNSDGVTASKWVPVVDQVLLMASIFLTYMAGVIPGQKSYIVSQKNISTEQIDSESTTSSGSATRNDGQVNPKYAWDIVRAKILDSQDVMEQAGKLGKRVLESDKKNVKRPLSLYAVAEGPRFRLLLAAFQQLEKEVNSSLGNAATIKMEDLLAVFDNVVQKSCWPTCIAWLENELFLEKNNIDKALVSLMFEKLEGNDTVLQTIRKSGKENLYAELLGFLRFGSMREGGCYDQSLFISHGVSILEDLVITLADGIASIYLELISVDSNLSAEMNSLGLFLCTLSTRALQRLRNEAIGHGIPNSLLDKVRGVAKQFFELPMEEKQKCLRSVNESEGYGSDTIVSEKQVLDWSHRLTLKVYPEDGRKLHLWPQNPNDFREIVDEYATKMKSFIDIVYKAMARSLNLAETSFSGQCGDRSLMETRFNFYPPCSRPDLVLGVKAHTDRSGITVLLQDEEVEGLQILQDGHWVRVPVIPHALVVNLGDQMQIMSNGIFRSPLHRAVTNTKKTRMSLAVIHEPDPEREIGAVDGLVDEKRPRIYRNVKNYGYINYECYQKGIVALDTVKL